MFNEAVNMKSGYNLRAFVKNSKVYNFSPGPAPIPYEVLNSIKEDLSPDSDYFEYGITPCEISHRSPEFNEIKNSAEFELRKLMNIPNNFQILWTQGGGHGQFAAIPLNMSICSKDIINYVVTGTWSQRAYKESKKFLNSNKITLSRFSHINETLSYDELIETNNLEEYLSEYHNYTYICSNETVNGLEYRDNSMLLPKIRGKLVVDMSSDFLTKRVNWDNIYVAFACTSKNLGMSGATVTIINKNFFNTNRYYEGKIPSILDWKLYESTDSLYNTPAIFNIYMIEKILKYYNTKGIDKIENESNDKAKLVYEYLDNNDLYKPFVNIINKNHRSNMNIPFYICDGNKKIMEDFLEYMFKQNIVGLRTKTPFNYQELNMKEPLRISLYNGISIEDVKYLIKHMEKFRLFHTSS